MIYLINWLCIGNNFISHVLCMPPYVKRNEVNQTSKHKDRIGQVQGMGTNSCRHTLILKIDNSQSR